jgi:hypothetical protein
MKISLVAALLCFTSFAHAHQYIQCFNTNPNTTDGTVINLDGAKSTLFMTTGLDDPEEIRILKPIKFLATEGDKTFYQAKDNDSIETITLPTDIIGKNSKNFFAALELKKVDGSMVFTEELQCYSATYNNN